MCRRRTPIGGVLLLPFLFPCRPMLTAGPHISVKASPHSTGEAAAHILPQITGVDPLHRVAVL